MNLKNFMLMSLFFICKNSNGMEIEDDDIKNEKFYHATDSKSKSDKIIIYFSGGKQEGGEQDLEMECHMKLLPHSPVCEGESQDEKKIKKGQKNKAFTDSNSDASKIEGVILFFFANMEKDKLDEYLNSKKKTKASKLVNDDIRKAINDNGLMPEENDLECMISYLRNTVREEKVDLERFRNSDNFYKNTLIDWDAIHEEVHQYLKENGIISSKLIKGLMNVDVNKMFAGKNNNIKTKLLEHMTSFCFNKKEKKDVYIGLYQKFVQRVMQIVFTNYDSWTEMENSSCREKLLINKEKINQAKSNISKGLLNDKDQDVLNVALVWLRVKRYVFENKITEKSQIERFFNHQLSCPGIAIDKINKFFLRKKIRSLLNNRELKGRGGLTFVEPSISLMVPLQSLYDGIKSPVFYDDALAWLQEQPNVVVCREQLKKVIAAYNRDVLEGNIIIEEMYRNLAKDLLLPKNTIKENKKNNKNNKMMHDSADEENESVCSDSEKDESNVSFRTPVKKCLNKEQQPLIVRQPQREEEQVFQAKASEEEGDKSDIYEGNNIPVNNYEGDYEEDSPDEDEGNRVEVDFFKKSAEGNVAKSMYPANDDEGIFMSEDDDKEEEKRNQ